MSPPGVDPSSITMPAGWLKKRRPPPSAWHFLNNEGAELPDDIIGWPPPPTRRHRPSMPRLMTSQKGRVPLDDEFQNLDRSKNVEFVIKLIYKTREIWILLYLRITKKFFGIYIWTKMNCTCLMPEQRKLHPSGEKCIWRHCRMSCEVLSKMRSWKRRKLWKKVPHPLLSRNQCQDTGHVKGVPEEYAGYFFVLLLQNITQDDD